MGGKGSCLFFRKAITPLRKSNECKVSKMPNVPHRVKKLRQGMLEGASKERGESPKEGDKIVVGRKRTKESSSGQQGSAGEEGNYSNGEGNF